MEKSTTEKTEWPTIEEQQSYWRTKEADLSLDKVESSTDYYDHFLDGNPTSEIPFHSDETDLTGALCGKEGNSPSLGETKDGSDKFHAFPGHNDGPYDGYWRPQDDPHIPDERRLSLENRKAPSASTLAEQKWAEPEWTLRDEVGESYREIP